MKNTSVPISSGSSSPDSTSGLSYQNAAVSVSTRSRTTSHSRFASAPAVRGHRAFWAGPYLVWQYARGGWAGLILPYPYYFQRLPKTVKPGTINRGAVKREAVKIANHVRYGAPTPPLVFPSPADPLA